MRLKAGPARIGKAVNLGLAASVEAFVTTTTPNAASIHKVRRDVRGGKRGDGHLRSRRVRRADPTRVHAGVGDATLTGVAGLASFGVFCRRKGIDTELKRRFAGLKDGKRVVYPMECQLRLLIDANVAGESRVFGLESLAPDPLFVHLAGGVVPSLDTVYRDLCRFDAPSIAVLEEMMAEQGVRSVRELGLREVHLDIDTTVESLFGSQEGALRGPILGIMREAATIRSSRTVPRLVAA